MSHYFRFKVQLRGVQFPIWRRFLLPVEGQFMDLHDAIQKSCGWQNMHLHTFMGEAGKDMGALVYDADAAMAGASFSLADWFGVDGKRQQNCTYWYDFGDDWLHTVELEGIEQHPADHGRRLLGGEGSFPAEDCGGLPGYERCLALCRARRAGRKKLTHEEAEFVEWLGDWDPEGFDLDLVRGQFEAAPVTRERRGAASGRGKSQAPPKERNVSGAAYRLARQVCRLVSAASLHDSGVEIPTAFPCQRRPKRRKCSGFVHVTRHEKRDEVDWRCPACGDVGTVSHWWDSPSDLRGLATEYVEIKADELTLCIPADVHGAFMAEDCLAIESLRLLHSATSGPHGIELRGSPDEFYELYEDACAEASHGIAGAFRKRIEKGCDLFRAYLENGAARMTQAPRPNPDEGLALVKRVTEGLRLSPADRDELLILYAALQSSPTVQTSADRERTDLRAVRDEAESITLKRRIEAVLAVHSVDYRHMSIFLQALDQTLESVEQYGAQCPQQGFILCRSFLVGLATIEDCVHVDENELGDFALEIAQVALQHSRAAKIGPSHLRPLLEELVVLFARDADGCTFGFVPDFLAKLKLQRREMKWLSSAIEQRLAEEDGDARTRLQVLLKQLA